MLRSSNKLTSFIQLNPAKRLTLNRKNLLIQIAFTTVNNTKHFIYFCMPIIDQFCAFYNDLKSSQLTDIKVIYSNDIQLIDPNLKHRLPSSHRRLSSFYQMTVSILIYVKIYRLFSATRSVFKVSSIGF